MTPQAQRRNIGKRGPALFGARRHDRRRSRLMFDILDKTSRTRALTDEESGALYDAMRALGMI